MDEFIPSSKKKVTNLKPETRNQSKNEKIQLPLSYNSIKP
jgi:hypothetical protein